MYELIGAAMAHLISILAALDWMQWILLWSLGFVVVVLWRCQIAEDGFDLKHLIADPNTGKLDRFAFGYLVGLVVFSWVVLSTSIAGRLTEWMLMFYTVYCAGPKSAEAWAIVTRKA